MATKCGFITVLGAPNAGKSTLVNTLVGTKVSIVSPKVQTTRFNVKGILNHDETQIVFVDTPGIFRASSRLEKAMVQAAWDEQEGADICLLVVDGKKGLDKQTADIIKALKKSSRQVVLVINKIDLLPKNDLLPLIARLNEAFAFTQTFLLSALNATTTADLKDYLLTQMPPGPWYFPPDQLTDTNDRMFSAEITREKVFLYLQQELPYSVYVTTRSWQENDEAVTIKQDIVVQRESQKTIILGKNGQMIKRIGTSARHELQYLLNKKVNLFLFVQVDKNWTADKENYQQMGLNFNVKN